MSRHWNLKQIILMALIAIVCGAASWGASFLYDGVVILLTPLGLKPFANDLLLGLWIMSGPLAACLLRIPGTAFVTEVIAAVAEAFFGDQWGIMDLVDGIVQGVGTEVGFALTRYRHYDWLGLTVSALTGTIVTFGYDLWGLGYLQYPIGMLIGLFLTRYLSLLVFGSWLPSVVVKLLRRSHVI